MDIQSNPHHFENKPGFIYPGATKRSSAPSSASGFGFSGKKWNWIIISLLILIIIISFFLRLVPIRLSHGWDETVYL